MSIRVRGPLLFSEGAFESQQDNYGDVAELADALDLGSSSFGSAGSTPVVPTAYRADLLSGLNAMN